MLFYRYKTIDLRITVVYRAKCFENEETRDKYNAWYQTASDDQVRPVGEIVNELKEELVKRRGIESSIINSLNPVQLAIAFIEEFIPYPFPAKSVIPYNYCIFIRLYPKYEPYLRYLC
uniref:Uncharacterized protein n=1 Tax=Panagrolaimus sp. PS1159 TaxID=55785 RepID=A0AC35F9A6_9BILA